MPENKDTKDAQGMLDLTRELKQSLNEKNEILQRSLGLQRDLVSSLQSESDFTKELAEGGVTLAEAKAKQLEKEDLLAKLQEARAEELEKAEDGNEMLVDILSEQIDKAEELNERMKEGVGELENANGGARGFADKLSSMTGVIGKAFKLPGGFLKGVGTFTKGMRGAAKGGAGFAKSIGKGMKALKLNPWTILLSIVVAIVKAVAAANNRITALAKGLGVSKTEARAVNQRMNNIARSSENVLNTSTEIKKAFGQINAFLGTSSTVISGQLMDGVATLQNRMGLTEKAAMGFAQSSLLTGDTIDDIKKSSLMISNTTSAIYGTRLDDKAVLEEAATTTGVIRAQSQGSLEILAKSVATAKSFGMSLKEVASAGRQLLNFEQSISAELEAELLTGRQLNLEQARLAALTGDYETLTKEIAKNVGSIHDFNKMNVLEQEAMAKAVGMEANQLADVLMKKQNLSELAEEARAMGEEELARQYEQLSTQQKFNAAIEKLKDFVVILVEQLEGGLSLIDLNPFDGKPSALAEAQRQFSEKQRNVAEKDDIQANARKEAQDYEKMANAITNALHKSPVTAKVIYDSNTAYNSMEVNNSIPNTINKQQSGFNG